MAKQTVGQAAAPEPLSATKRTKLCAEWARLDAERLDFDRQARARADAQKAIQKELDAQRLLDGVTVVDLPRWEFGVELVAGSMYYKDELIREIGFDEFERRKAAVPQREKFFLREKERAAKAAKGKKRVA